MKTYFFSILILTIIVLTIGSCSNSNDPTNQLDDNIVYKVGDIGPSGGIIFYYDPQGFTVEGYGNPGDTGYFASYSAHYLEAASADIGDIVGDGSTRELFTWALNTSPVFSTISEAQGLSIGTGRKNTAEILKVASPNPSDNSPAANACSTYFINNYESITDWFLPSRDELSELFKAKQYFSNYDWGASGLSVYYWSSSQSTDGPNWAWTLLSDSGYQTFGGKDFERSVRPIRAF